MAENKGMHIENIKQASDLIKNGSIEELIKSTAQFENSVKGLKNNLEDKLKALTALRKEKEAQEKVAEEAVPQVEPVKEKEKKVEKANVKEEPEQTKEVPPVKSKTE